MKWFRRHHAKLEYAVCTLCCAKFLLKECEKLKQCPVCKHTGEKTQEEKDSLKRIGS